MQIIPLISDTALGKLVNQPVPWFPHWSYRDHKSTSLRSLLRRFNEWVFVEQLTTAAGPQ